MSISRGRDDSDKDISIFGYLSDVIPEDHIMLPSIFFLGGVDVVGVDLMTLSGEVDCHGKAHVTEADEANLGKGVEGGVDKFHLFE